MNACVDNFGKPTYVDHDREPWPVTFLVCIRFVWLPLLLTLLMVAGCTKPAESARLTSRSPEATPPPVAPGQTDSRTVIVAFGDSLSEGFGVEPGKSFPDQLQRKLDEKGLAYSDCQHGRQWRYHYGRAWDGWITQSR